MQQAPPELPGGAMKQPDNDGALFILSRGLWRLRRDLETLTGLEAVKGRVLSSPPQGAIVCGWGHKPTASRAQRLAQRRGLPYYAVEDGFLRSVRPGRGEPPSSLVIDSCGIYYDARSPSDLERLLQDAQTLTEAEAAATEHALDALRRNRLSKYNGGLGLDRAARAEIATSHGSVLVVDQTFEDASVPGALADSASFDRMLVAAIDENPRARVIVKLHPEVAAGTKRGYLASAGARGATVISEPVNPWDLIDHVDRVYTVSSQFGFDALLGGRTVSCFGMPFYAGWGLTDDRVTCPRRDRRLSLVELVHASLFRYCRYLDAWTRAEIGLLDAIEQLAFLRRSFLSNRRKVVAYRVTAWKRRTIGTMLDGPAGRPRHRRRLAAALAEAKSLDADLLAWGGTARRIRQKASDAGVRLVTVEDGFLRSVGLGASFTPALSYIFDTSGIYYDPARASDLEFLLSDAEFGPDLLVRARSLIDEILAKGITKYNLAQTPSGLSRPTAGRVVLVPGQVADDESVRLGGPEYFENAKLSEGGANLTLLRRTRERHPDAYIIFRPHPDVSAGLRAGGIPEPTVRRLADHMDVESSLTSLIALSDQIETVTSLAGFEALLRGKNVTVHGRPFYAGWGLTEDLAPLPRRGRPLTLEQLVAGALLLYPRYVDPISGRPCPAEVALERLIRIGSESPKLSTRLRAFAGGAFARLRHRILAADRVVFRKVDG